MRWGIVGFGWVARDFMAPGIAAAGGAVVAVCDRDERAQTAAERIGARTHDTLAGLLGETVDAIYVATPNHLHRDAVEACLAAGVPVLCEKPVAATLDDAVAMADAARRTGVLLGTAFDQRFHPAHLAIRREIVRGTIGTPTAMRIVYGCWLDREWSAPLGGADNWRIDRRRAGGGAMMDLAPHGLDLAAMLLGEPLGTLTGVLQRRVHDYEVDDGGMLVGGTPSGVLVCLHNAYNLPETLPRRRLEICGTGGQIVATDTMGQAPGGRIEIVDAATGASRELGFDAGQSPFAAQAHAFAAAVRGAPHAFDIDRDVASLSLLLSACAASQLSPRSFVRQPS